MKTYDIVVIGGGSAGLTVAAGAAQFGAEVALIEKKNTLGGDCLHYGCVPSKALIAAAKEVHQLYKSAKRFGLTVHGKPGWQTAKEKVKEAVASIQEHDSEERFRGLGIDVIFAGARFRDNHHIQLSSGSIIKGKRIVIATGSSPVIPPIEGIEHLKVATNETVFDMENLPERMVMVGGGPVGLELSQALSRLGVHVTIVDSASEILQKEDEDISKPVREQLKLEMTVLTSSTVEKVIKKEGKTFVVIRGEHSQELEADTLFIAAGRKPNTEGLALEKAGVEVNKKGEIIVKETLQTSQANIYAAGDVNGAFPFTHAAGHEGKTIVANAVFGLKRKVSYENVPWAFYTDPEIFHLGKTEKEVRKEKGRDYRVYSMDCSRVDRMIAEQDKLSVVKVITDKKGKILGAHAAGGHASDWMQQLIYMKTNDDSFSKVSNSVYPYPSRGEIVKNAGDLYWREKLFESGLSKVMAKYVSLFR
ncbi:dihydrolipoyl dehydrogenase family protein [Salipaludibacillus aurantiacus]|uniref:Pyruvate/2-oxoglutarate dehydrogenase complex, dihydrolipoamide dehydrogenase (E3) component n=1 Tax=Salipaludibacillus aurantiacus TaxID=1601833 RepID=A0A1H9RTY2_9BACI|nr:FAD-dependent oxidoreductase [Salipaludibacillus aurantiacus]SER75583.1 Pyruvate/2-oxoglutarate dehydrogenase complex, dihydrolipoamide dehydrogenase (E3) component [Salipaludibacillus aurantiacus]